MQVSTSGRNFIKGYEAYREFAYPDPGSPLAKQTKSMRLRWGFRPASEILDSLPANLRNLSAAPWTVGYGETRGVTSLSRMTRSEAEAAFVRGLREFEEGVEKACRVQPTQSQFDAMVSLAYNIGLGWSGAVKPKGAKDGFRQSTVLRAHNSGDTAAAARAFGFWNKSGGQVMPGLVARRAAEAAVYLQDQHDSLVGNNEGEASSAVEVEPERSMGQSEINRAATIAGGTAALGAAADAARTVSDVKYNVTQLGDWLVPILLIAVVALCGYIVWQRYQQRKGGWS